MTGQGAFAVTAESIKVALVVLDSGRMVEADLLGPVELLPDGAGVLVYRVRGEGDTHAGGGPAGRTDGVPSTGFDPRACG
jgi:hypothetical protein